MITCGELFSNKPIDPDLAKPKRKRKEEDQDKYAVLLCAHDQGIEQYRSPYESDCMAWLRYHKADIPDGWNLFKTADGVLYRIARLNKEGGKQ